MRHYSDNSRKKLSESGKKAMANRWSGHSKQTKAEYNAYQKEYQREYYHRRKALQQAVDELDCLIKPVSNEV
jgi:Skp family chaperone for outer membrane proteins